MLASLCTVCALGVQALKLHHLQVIRATPLERLSHQGQVEVFDLDAIPANCCCAFCRTSPLPVTLHRLWSTAHPDLLVAPRWGRLAADLSGRLQAMMAERDIRQGQLVNAEDCSREQAGKEGKAVGAAQSRLR
jgi:uncharacterized protein